MPRCCVCVQPVRQTDNRFVNSSIVPSGLNDTDLLHSALSVSVRLFQSHARPKSCFVSDCCCRSSFVVLVALPPSAKKTVWAENSDRRVKKIILALASCLPRISILFFFSSSVSLSPAKPPHPVRFFLSIHTHIFSFLRGGVGCWNFPSELYLREQPVPTVYIVPTGLSNRAINREHG